MAAQDSLSIAEALALEGIEDAQSIARARTVLDALKITNPSRDRISREKQSRLHDAIHREFLPHCSQSACAAHATEKSRPGLLVVKARCAVCGGSNTRRAVHETLALCLSAGIRRVCLVGGSPGVREELLRQLGSDLKLTLVDGTKTPSSNQARAHVRSHDVTVICGASELSHKLSNTYEACQKDGYIITAPRRGVEAIAEALSIHARTRLGHAR